MISSLNAANSEFLTQMNAIQARMARAQKQLSTGSRINDASDAPDQISELLSARASLANAQQTNQNLTRVKTEVDSAESGLSQASTAIQQARVLGTQGANTTQTADTRKTLGDQVGTIIEQVVGISRTTVEGRYIFSGDSDQTPPYTVDLTQANPVSAYQGSPSVTRQVQHPNGSTFTVGETAQQIFDAPSASDNVLSSLVALRSALLNNDSPGISAALDTLGTSSTYFERQLAFYGNAQNKVVDASTYGSSLELNLQTQVGNIQDADSTQAILELTQAQTAQKAALQAKASVPLTSLFDFLR
jgi:flagellar hook-associated protein 3 FlgL